MKLEGVRGSRERRSGARLNRWPTVTGAWLNMRPFYLQTEGQHSPPVPLARPLLTTDRFWQAGRKMPFTYSDAVANTYACWC